MKLKELFSDSLPIIEKFAPSVGTAIGGPVGIAAGYAIPLLASAFGSKPSNIREIASKILTDADAQSKLEEIEHEHGDWICTLTDSLGNLSRAEIHINLEWYTGQK